MKKFTWVLIAVALLAVVVAPTMALANNGPHGGYVSDTDMCAQCHRAHTAPSSITWTDNQGGQKNALLLTDEGQAYLFCLACHDTASQGADTNVMGGAWEGTALSGDTTTALLSGAFGSVNLTKPAGAMYDSNGVAVTSAHLMNGGSWGAFGGGLYGHDSTELTSTGDPVGNQADLYGTGNKIVMSCVTCHDPHGSSNYRILKDVVNGVTVGGYDAAGSGVPPIDPDSVGHWTAQNPKPTPFVISNETGFPQGGFQLHISYKGTYVANYTVAKYAIPTSTAKGMTGWCVGCHTTYNIAARGSSPASGTANYIFDSSSTYNAGDSFGKVTRHRHPMNVPLSNYLGPQALVTDSSLGLPLDHPVGASGTYDGNNWIECLTCHNAHGSTATMAGWSDLGAKATVDVVGSRGVMPVDSNLLKLNNRAVCERCHNK